jgi:ABC-type molybdate transport system substrate-binding protein
MRSCLHFGAAVLAMAIGLTSDPPHAAEVRLAAAVGVRQVLMELAPQFEAATGHKVASTFEAHREYWSSRFRQAPASMR